MLTLFENDVFFVALFRLTLSANDVFLVTLFTGRLVVFLVTLFTGRLVVFLVTLFTGLVVFLVFLERPNLLPTLSEKGALISLARL